MFEMGELDRGRMLAPVQDCLQGNSNYNYNLHHYQQAVHQHHLNYAQANNHNNNHQHNAALSHSQTVGHQSASLYPQAPVQTSADYYQSELHTAAAAAAAAYNQVDQCGPQRPPDHANYRRFPEATYYNTQSASYQPPAPHQETSDLSYYHSDSYYLLDSGGGGSATNSGPTYYQFPNSSHEFSKQVYYNGNEQHQLRSLAETTANPYQELGTAPLTASETSLAHNGTSHDEHRRAPISMAALNQQQQFAKSCRLASERVVAVGPRQGGTKCEAKLVSVKRESTSLSATNRRAARTNPMGTGKESVDQTGCAVIARRKNATRSTTIIMKLWLRVRCHNPYPTRAEKTLLVKSSSMTNTQVSTWLANARRRLKKEGKFYEWMNHRPPQQQRRAASELMSEMVSNTGATRPNRPRSACSSSSSTASSSASGSSSSSLEALVTAAAAAIANAPDEVKTFVTSLIRTASRKRRRNEQVGSSSVVSPPLSISSSSPSAGCSSSSRTSSTNSTSLVPLRPQPAANNQPVGQLNSSHSQISQSNQPSTTCNHQPDCSDEFNPSPAKL